MNASAAQAIEDAAYVARILEDSLRLSQMFEPGNEPDELGDAPRDDGYAPRGRASPDAGYAFDYDDGFGGGFGDVFDNDYEHAEDAAASAAPQEKKKRKTESEAGGQPKRARAGAAVPQLRDHSTWKFAKHNPTATRFRSQRVVGPIFVTKVDRSDPDGPDGVLLWGKRYLKFDSLIFAEVRKDDDNVEYFHIRDDPVYGEGGEKIRPSTKPDCDADVAAAKLQQQQRELEAAAADKRRRLANRRARHDRLRREEDERREFARAWKLNPETLHVGDFVRFQNPTVERMWSKAQVLAMQDPRLPWHHKLPWEFDGPFAGHLTASTPVQILRPEPAPFLVNLGEFLAPKDYERPIESERVKNARRIKARVDQSIENAFRGYARGAAASSS